MIDLSQAQHVPPTNLNSVAPPGSARVLDVWSHVSPHYGGVGPAAAGLATAVAQNSDWKSTMLAFCSPGEATLSDGIPERVIRIQSSRLSILFRRASRTQLAEAVASCDICHVHGLWLPQVAGTRFIARHKPIISSVHGMLEKWDLNNKRLKKAIYSALIERRSLSRSHCLRALSEHEVEDYRNFDLRCPIAVIPNGIGQLGRTPVETLYARFPHLKDKLIVLFMGRVHYKKGILNLLDAWRLVTRKYRDAHLLIAGPDYAHTRQKAEEMVNSASLNHTVTFCGTISGELKLAALSAARFFCLPTYSEGLSVAVLEALSIGLPVIATPECNVDGIDSHGAGFIVSNAPAELAAGLCECLNLSNNQWTEMSRNARHLAASSYSWDRAGERMREVYAWALGGKRPSFVV
jgi:glycosyltransferase involved in cell wall biosynthesis